MTYSYYKFLVNQNLYNKNTASKCFVCGNKSAPKALTIVKGGPDLLLLAGKHKASKLSTTALGLQAT